MPRGRRSQPFRARYKQDGPIERWRGATGLARRTAGKMAYFELDQMNGGGNIKVEEKHLEAEFAHDTPETSILRQRVDKLGHCRVFDVDELLRLNGLVAAGLIAEELNDAELVARAEKMVIYTKETAARVRLLIEEEERANSESNG